MTFVTYADTNFYTRLYLPLAESEEAAGLLADAQAALSPPLPVTWLHRLETINAFQLHVFAGKSHGHTRITSEQAAAAHATFQTDLAQPLFLRLVELSVAELQAQFEELALRRTASHGFRTYDLLQPQGPPTPSAPTPGRARSPLCRFFMPGR